MSNDYYTNATNVVAGNKAKAEDINSRMELIEDGFDNLPSCVPEAPTTKGFDEAFTIIDSTNEYHPPTSKQVRDGELTFAQDSGVANAIVADLPQAPSAYVTGLSVTIQLNATNTGTTTVNLNGLGVKSVKRLSGDELTGGDCIAGRIVSMRYNGSYFQLIDGMYAIHNHDDLYYREDEIDTFFTAYYTSVESDARYYTKVEVDSLNESSAEVLHTAGSTLTASDLVQKKLHTNTGATGETSLQLPPVEDGMVGRFLVQAAHYFRFIAAVGETIKYAGSTTATNGYMRSDSIGSYCRIEGVNGNWIVTDIVGGFRYDM